MSNNNMTQINNKWKRFYDEYDNGRVRKISFIDEKINRIDVCSCDKKNSLSCAVHDGSNERNTQFFNLIKIYFAKLACFNENDVLNIGCFNENDMMYNYDLISSFLQTTRDIITRLELRRRKIFEECLISCLKKRFNSVHMSEDFDPQFIARWDNSYLDMIAAKKQFQKIKISLIRGGSRDLNGTLEYGNIHVIKKLIRILENSQEQVFSNLTKNCYKNIKIIL